MRKFVVAVFAIALVAASALGQTSAPTLRIVTDDPNLPSDLYYGNTKVKPLRLRPGTNQRITIDDADFFVQQNYVDFLSRFPDASGLAYWADQFTRCGNDQQCIADQRVAVSAAFFVSTEFQETGYYVYRFYKGALNRQPNYAEFTPDRRQVVASANLEASKQAFSDAFVSRPEFLQKYPANMSADTFVSALLQSVKESSGVDLSAQRANLVTLSRSAAVRKVLDSQEFQAAEYNRAFVLMQYFGYLRRDPDKDGYNFWVDILNNKAPGNFRGMVKAFLTSQEYRDRF